MAQTTGLVQRLTVAPLEGFAAAIACVWIGPSPTNTEVLVVVRRDTDSTHSGAFRNSIVHLLAKAQAAGYEVTLSHPADGAEVTSVTCGEFDVCPIGAAVHGDFYSVSGSAIPSDAVLVFESDSTVVTVTPDVIRPHWAFVAELSAALSVGRNTVKLEGSGWSSEAVPIDVFASPPATVRMLYSGAPKGQPYTIAFVANPAIETESGALVADSILTDRPGFHDVVGYCLGNLLAVTEDLLRQDDLDAYIRFVAIFDPSQGVSDDNALAHEIPPNLMETRRSKINAFLARFSEVADMVFVVHGSSTHDRATAWYTTDDANQPGTPYTYDGASRVHGHYQSVPGSAAVPVNMNQTGLTPIHEFGHGASDFNNGRVNDLYNDLGPSGFVVNKMARANSAAPIPVNFASYNGTNYQSDQNRDGLGYPANWTSYHPALIDATRPNMMDNYWFAFDDPKKCRLDQLAYDWFSDRLKAKIFR